MEFASSSLPSSSSAFLTSKPHFIHDVFINFGGEDIGRRFVSHLHYVLLQSQFKTFISQVNLHEGMKLVEHIRAIEHTKIMIIVFSQSYTESACCLFELEKIIECHETFGQVILPVFYEIEPWVVCHQYDDFGKALEDAAHKSYSGEQVEHALSKWRRALSTAARMIGWDVRDFRHDAELVKQIVWRVKVSLNSEDFRIAKYPVGLKSRVEDVIKYIENQSSKVCIIGIWGMAGSGKTTIAKTIYNRIYRRFNGKSFIENIRYEGYVPLQENLLSNVLKSKFLIVLDDVNESAKLENICGSREWFGQGTVIIITTRDFHLLKQLRVNYVYKMRLLNENESLELFSWNAFGDEIPKKEWSELARNAVDYCRGLPLALQFLGSYLYDRTIEVWESVLLKLQRNPPDEVLGVLKIIFDDLCDTEKDIFLDVCCFFIGKDRHYVTEILNGCGLHANIGITILIERGFIKSYYKLEMNPWLQDMGREIIRQKCAEEQEKRSRLWLQDDVKDILKENTGTEAILSLKLDSSIGDCFDAHAFKEMKRLRLLQLDHVQLSGDYGNISKQLIWIRWRGFPYRYIPINLHLENVIAIDFKHSYLQLVWEQRVVLERLKFLNLSHSKYLIETPDFSGLPSLEQVILKDCPSLLKVHPSIGNLSNILVINLKDCTNLIYLPIKVYELRSLKTLILSGCLKLRPFDKTETRILFNCKLENYQI